MSVILNPYIGFKDQARAAMEFYQSVFGGELNVMNFGDVPGTESPETKGLVMHSQLTTDNGLTIMAADTTEEPYNGSISLSGDDEATIRGYWDKLVVGGEVGEPLVQAPWGDTFGMLKDKFGIHWMFNIAGQLQG
jgi:PhnB protein